MDYQITEKIIPAATVYYFALRVHGEAVGDDNHLGDFLKILTDESFANKPVERDGIYLGWIPELFRQCGLVNFSAVCLALFAVYADSGVNARAHNVCVRGTFLLTQFAVRSRCFRSVQPGARGGLTWRVERNAPSASMNHKRGQSLL